MNWHGLATYQRGGSKHPGLVVNDTLYDLAQLARACGMDPARVAGGIGALIADWADSGPVIARMADRAARLAASGQLAAVEGATYAVPYQPRRIFATASNFYEHADEMGTKLAARSESQPYIFMKAETSVVATGENVRMPSETSRLDWEVELGVVIGKTCRHVQVDDALSAVAAYTVFNDISARDLNRRTDYPFTHDWFRGKSFDTFGPMGPWLVPAGCIADPQDLRMTLAVNGETMQDGSTAEMIFSVAEQIAYLSRILTLHPGDMIATGTPDGVGMGRGVYLKPGDAMVARIENIGTIENTVVQETR